MSITDDLMSQLANRYGKVYKYVYGRFPTEITWSKELVVIYDKFINRKHQFKKSRFEEIISNLERKINHKKPIAISRS